MRKLILGVAVAFTLVSAAGAQQGRPNFSGQWTAITDTGAAAGSAQIVAVGARPDGGRAFFFFNDKDSDPRLAQGQAFFFFNAAAPNGPRPMVGAQITIAQDASALTVEYLRPDPATKLIYRLGGGESRNIPPPARDADVVSTAAWDGGKLVITHVQNATVRQQAVTITSTQTLSLDADGRLVVETRRGTTTTRTIYRKN